MLKYILERTIRSFFTLIIIISIVFCLLRFMPIEGYFTNFEKLTPFQIENGLQKLGLTQPIPIQLLEFLKGLTKGDLGVSHIYRVNVPVLEIINSRIGLSFFIGILSLLLSLILGLPLGIWMAANKGKLIDKIGTFVIIMIQGVPAAIYHLFLQVYGTRLFRLPLLFNKRISISVLLPILSLSLGNLAYYSMWLRRFMVDELNKDYVKLAIGKGLPKSKIMYKHIFRNAMVPLVQYLPTSFLLTIIGSIYIESLYSIPGMGGLLVDVIQRQDNTMVQGLVIIYSMVSILGLLIGDILMALADPRITYGKKKGVK